MVNLIVMSMKRNLKNIRFSQNVLEKNYFFHKSESKIQGALLVF